MARVVQVGSVTRVRGASVIPAASLAVDMRRAAGVAARLCGSVTVTTVAVARSAMPPRVATVRPLPHRHAPKPPTTQLVITGGAVIGTVAAAGFWLGYEGVGVPLLQMLAGPVVLAAVVGSIVCALKAGRCPGIHCGGCRG